MGTIYVFRPRPTAAQAARIEGVEGWFCESAAAWAGCKRAAGYAALITAPEDRAVAELIERELAEAGARFAAFVEHWREYWKQVYDGGPQSS